MNNWKEYKNGNYTVRINLENGTKIRYNNEDSMIPEYPESIDITITNQCNNECDFCYMGCSKNGRHGDIMSAKFIDTLLPYTELAINGNSMNHPDMTRFLEKLKLKNLIANITVNQRDFMNNQEILKYYRDNGLIYGIGVSLVAPTDEFIKTIKEYPNAVIHVVNGIVRKEALEKLYNKGLKILILGYKEVGFGKYYYKEFSDKIDLLKIEMYENIENMMDKFSVVSFDNLALEQLNVKRFMTEKEWNNFFMGDDGHKDFTSASMYIDMVNNTFSYNSMDSEKFELMDDIKDMFEFLMKKKMKKVVEAT